MQRTSFKVFGDALDNRFELHFSGEHRVASILALQFYESLQVGRGQWKKQVVEDDRGNEIKFYVAPDKNPCQIRREILSKHLKDILANNSVDKDLYFKKRQVLFMRANVLWLLLLLLVLRQPVWTGATLSVLNWVSSRDLWSRNLQTMLSAGGRAPNSNLLPISLCGDNLQSASCNGRGIVVHRSHEYFDMGNAI